MSIAGWIERLAPSGRYTFSKEDVRKVFPLMSATNTVQNLIDQVYQFSRIYRKSIKQQNLPVAIKYPEMVARIAPHFTGGVIPTAIGRNNLWFL